MITWLKLLKRMREHRIEKIIIIQRETASVFLYRLVIEREGSFQGVNGTQLFGLIR